jgi:peptidyl-tRNA hydrolase, PTH1 family
VHVIVGLGNPGSRYQHSRHNIGFDVVDLLARQHHIGISQREAKALCGTGGMNGQRVMLVKPQTYMNASGEAVGPVVQRHLHSGEHLIVVHDDIDLPLGKIKVKRQGGDAGHLGIRSLIAHLGNGDFVRLRLGIGRPSQKADIVRYVLEPFAEADTAACQAMMLQAVQHLEQLISAPPDA